MKTYLVGGAVRDKLLGLEPRELDWVVVGGTPQDMLEAGYTQVGASFPVFLHPETKQEYALARTESKSGRGYHGFEVNFDPGVSLEQDLRRRDLTVNAMAMDDQGGLIDPFAGQVDLERRLLRHVSPAFSEDPLRVLRVARFAARLADLGFTVAPETRDLMQGLSESGELDALVPERVWQELEKALNDAHPARFIESLRDCGALAELWPEIHCLFGIPQSGRYHPEIDTGVHVLMTLDMAWSMQADVEVVFACLMHDLGKGLTPKDVLPAHRGHELAGLPLVEAFCERTRAPARFRKLAMVVCEHHLRCHRVMEMKAKKVLHLVEAVGGLRNREQFDWFLLACEADFRGRGGNTDAAYPQAGYLRQALEATLAVSVADLAERGLSGPQIAGELHRRRVEAIGNEVVKPG